MTLSWRSLAVVLVTVFALAMIAPAPAAASEQLYLARYDSYH